jgi:hypothetical protein
MIDGLMAALLAVQAGEITSDADLLPAWHGEWSGALQTFPESSETASIDVALTIGPGDDPFHGCLDRHMRYSRDGQLLQEKSYRICQREDGLVIDEGGGVELAARVFEDRLMVSQFSVQGRYFTSREAVEDDTLTIEIVFTGPQDETGGDLVSFPTAGLQRIVLQRAPD